MADAMAALKTSAPYCVTQTLIEGTQSPNSKKLGLAPAKPVSSLSLTESDIVAAEHANCFRLVQAQGRDIPARKGTNSCCSLLRLRRAPFLSQRRLTSSSPWASGSTLSRELPLICPRTISCSWIHSDTSRLNIQLSYAQL